MANVFTYNDQDYRTGDTVSVRLHVSEGDKTRIQLFDGLIIKINGSGNGKSFTVRKIGANSVGVERLLPVACPSIAGIDKKAEGKVRRAKLYFLRDRVGKRALKVKVKDNRGAQTPTKSAKVKADAKPAKKATNRPSKTAGKPRRTAGKKAATK